MTVAELPNRRIAVSPSLLAADFTRLAEEIASVEAAGAEVIHCDVMDGHFVPNISFGQPVIASIRRIAKRPLDVHLMISHPARYAASFAKAGADHLTFHLEAEDGVRETIAAIRSCGCTVGISLKPATPPRELLPFLNDIDLILVMTVEPGFGGQKFMADQMPKLDFLRAAIEKSHRNIQLEVDGGVDSATAPVVAAHGANLLVAGTAVFRNPAGIPAALEQLRSAQPLLDQTIAKTGPQHV